MNEFAPVHVFRGQQIRSYHPGSVDIQYPASGDTVAATFWAYGTANSNVSTARVDALLSNAAHSYTGIPAGQPAADWDFLFENVEPTSATNPDLYTLTVTLTEGNMAVASVVNNLQVQAALTPLPVQAGAFLAAPPVQITEVNENAITSLPVQVSATGFTIGGTCTAIARLAAVIRYVDPVTQKIRRLYGQPLQLLGREWLFSFENLSLRGQYEVRVFAHTRRPLGFATVPVSIGP